MKALRDPEGAELSHINNTCDLSGKTVLEIGCGEGKLTYQYSGMAGRVIGIDPELSDLNVAKHQINSLDSFFIQAIGERLPFPSKVFDIVIFSSSL
jgi:ubiquinone/menaquinone biosynthesis C-methylase UbiE